jgi:YVTN family beta-propeller protein
MARTRLVTLVASLGLGLTSSPAASGDFAHFEASHVHPLALSERGDRLYAVNTPESRLAIFGIGRRGELTLLREVPVGLEPVSVARRPDTEELWIANHLSDSISIVDGARGQRIATLHVGDEPTDVAFARGRAFVALAGAESRVAVFDPDTRLETHSIDVFASDPRALAVSPGGRRVGLVVLESGNATTSLPEGAVARAGGPPPPDPPRGAWLPVNAPRVSLIVRHDPVTGRFADETGGDWSALADYALPDRDLFLIDAESAALVETVSGVGTSLFEVAFHPRTGAAWIPNTEAHNHVRFEPKLRGRFADTRVTIVDPGGRRTSVDLNPHVDESVTPGPPEEVALSLAQPGDGTFDRSGGRFYLTAFGSSKVAVLDGDSGRVLHRIDVAGGPSGVALDQGRNRLYVMSRFDHAISIVDTKRLRQVGSAGLSGPAGFDPSPPAVRDGRRFLYDARNSSGHGDLSCASCHLFANLDGLAWDLGDPQGEIQRYRDADWLRFAPNRGTRTFFDPMKGPMVTQTLRGLAGMEPFHWRGDRRNFQHFNGAFVSLMGRAAPLSDAEMDAFTAFIMTVGFPPNPFRGATDQLPSEIRGGDPTRGAELFAERGCHVCHAAPAGTTNNLTFATVGSQDIKIAHLRGVYEKMDDFVPNRLIPGVTANLGAREQRSGFGVLHGGALSIHEFLRAFGFSAEQSADVAAFLRAFPTGTPPCVGREVELTDASPPEALERAGELLGEAALLRCDVTARLDRGGAAIGWRYDPTAGGFRPDSGFAELLPAANLFDHAARGDRLTLLAVPAGSGSRLGIDRDRDGCLDADEAVRDDGHCYDPTLARIVVQPHQRVPFVRRDEDGSIRVALLGSDALDVGDVDLASLAFGPGGAALLESSTRGHARHEHGRPRDLDRDGHPDLLLRFDVRESALFRGAGPVCLLGRIAGAPFRSCDDLVVTR